MKLVIDHSETKRQIEGAFSLCGSRSDLAELAAQIQNRLRDESWSYGWMTVYPAPVVHPNTKPRSWDE